MQLHDVPDYKLPPFSPYLTGPIFDLVRSQEQSKKAFDLRNLPSDDTAVAPAVSTSKAKGKGRAETAAAADDHASTSVAGTSTRLGGKRKRSWCVSLPVPCISALI